MKSKLNKLMEQSGQKALKAVLQPPKNSDSFISQTGGTFWDLEGAKWPNGPNGYLRPLIQININELPYVPERVKNLEGLAVYIDSEYVEYGAESEEGGSVVVRELPKGSVLKQLTPPVEFPFEEKAIEWEEIDDFPTSFDFDGILEKNEIEYEDFEDELYEKYDNYGFTKINGWPTAVQAPSTGPAEPHEFIIQISLDIDIPFGDSTVFTIDYSEKIGKWFTAWETC